VVNVGEKNVQLQGAGDVNEVHVSTVGRSVQRLHTSRPDARPPARQTPVE